MCRARVRRGQMGKHLLSHYHCRVAGTQPSSPRSQRFLLENMANVARQCPFQCASCRFYCNTEDTFLRHWRSDAHKDTVSMVCRAFIFHIHCVQLDILYGCSLSHARACSVLSFGICGYMFRRLFDLNTKACGKLVVIYVRFSYRLDKNIFDKKACKVFTLMKITIFFSFFLRANISKRMILLSFVENSLETMFFHVIGTHFID